MKVEQTTVWYRGRSASFTPQEVAAGKGDEWLVDQQAFDVGLFKQQEKPS